MKELRTILDYRKARSAEGGVLATLVHVSGSSYRRPGARLLIGSGNIRLGSISGGCLEDDVIARAAEVARSGKPETVIYDTTSENDLVWGVGLGCHGVVHLLLEKLPDKLTPWEMTLIENLDSRIPTSLAVRFHGATTALGTKLADASDPTLPGVFLDRIAPPTSLVIFGAGEDAKPLVQLASELGWFVTIADPRPAMAIPDRFPTANRVHVLKRKGDGFDLSGLLLEKSGAAVIMTHHYVHDKPLLAELASFPLAYLGLLGPKKRALKIVEEIAASGFCIPDDSLSRLHAPVGLDIGAETPQEVALAILAEIQARLTGRQPIHLSSRQLPIHD